MKRGFILGLAIATAASAIAADAAPRRATAPARVDWTHEVVATPQGGFRMGNPNARVKLVEYGSITCPHCALFSAEGSRALRDTYVKSGRVSWEYRPFMIFPTDPGIFMLLRCQGRARFFPTAQRLYAEQPIWTQRIQSLPVERARQIDAMNPRDKLVALVQAGGTAAYFGGMSPARVKACLSDQRNLNTLVAITERAGKDGVTGTPAFFINGKRVAAPGWEALEPLLKAAGG
jgi:protein-disulfide isomerase